MEESLLQKSGKKVILLGNEAVVRGALEEGVDFVSTYPGTPASEIGNVFFELFQEKKYKGYFEFSTNEKTALEAGIGASFSGLKTLVAMKNFGLNVCLDSLLPFIYTGVKGPTVIVVADDPSCHSSGQSEENSRFIGFLGHVPVLEPADPQECKDFVKAAFKISQNYKIPVIIRTTTRVAHQKMPVVLGRILRPGKAKGKFVKDPRKFITLPPRVLEMKDELLAKMGRIKNLSEKSVLNLIANNSQNKNIGIITSGVSYLNTMEALAELKLSAPVLKLGFFNPLPEEKIKKFIKPLKKVLIVEEMEPYLEKEVARLAREVNCRLTIGGKFLLPQTGELKPEQVVSAIAEFVGLKYKKPTQAKVNPLKRPSQLCPGCPYWLVISAIKKAVDAKKVIFGGEIGCYMLFGNSPINLQDYLFDMGSSVGIAHGIKKATGQKLISFVGDSSFFHAGMPALANAVFNKSNPLIIVLNNGTTAMTGHQPHPAAINEIPGINIEAVVSALGVKHVRTIDPINQPEFIKTVKDFLIKKEVSVIIAKHPCLFAAKKMPNLKPEQFNMMIFGAGGQGLITLLQVISEAALIEGYDIKTSELHGLSQRGGSVEVHIRFGKKIYSPLISQGKADLILSLEIQESLRGAYFANSQTKFLVNKFAIPIPLVGILSEKEAVRELVKVSQNVNLVAATDICKEKLDTGVVAGIYLLALAVSQKMIPLEPGSVLRAIKKIIPKKYLELNLKAFKLASNSEAVE